MTFVATAIALCLLCSVTTLNATAGDWQILVLDQDGKPLEDAVVELVVLDTPQPTPPQLPTSVTVKQQGLNFVPFVSAIQVGTEVDFPNLDRTRHHVFSFSPAKVFEIQLYHGRPEQPVRFDQAGIVALGCNIHDYMEAYVFISNSPLLQVTNARGEAQFQSLGAGRYQLRLWHPFQQEDWALIEVEHKGNSQSQYQLTVQHRPKQPTPQRGFGS